MSIGRTCTCPNGPMPGHYVGCPLAGKFGLPRPAVPTHPDALAPHPGEHHEYRMACIRCGEPGYLFVGFHSPGETYNWIEKAR